jgi:hypothetical protein
MPAPKKKAAKRSPAKGSHKLNPGHKQALAAGRTMSATVDRYLAAVNTPKRRGRKVSKETLEARLAAALETARSATGVEKVLAAQEVRDLRARLAQMNGAGAADMTSLEAAFVEIANRFGENRGIGYAAWRDAGVPAAVLKKAGITRTRS